MLKPEELKLDFPVFHDDEGLGKISEIDLIAGRCSLVFENGINLHRIEINVEIHKLHHAEEAASQRSKMKIDKQIEQLRSVLASVHEVTDIYPGTPEPEDRALARKWLNGNEKDSSFHEARMLSARMAERAVSKYFGKMNISVEDVSIQQLENGSNGEWRIFDLRVRHLCLDVKNARRSLRNRRAYVKHCVPKYKYDRQGGEVRIAGALSERLSIDEIEIGQSTVKYLGVVTQSRINCLRDMLKDGPLGFDVASAQSPEFLPPWIFDHSGKIYSNRNQELEHFKQSLLSEDIAETQIKKSWLPAIIASGINPIPNMLIPVESWQRSFASLLQSRQQQYGASLPVLFLTILEHFVGMLRDRTTSDYDPVHYAPLIFSDDRCKNMPLYLLDPEWTVESLIQSLSILWKNRNKALKDMRFFDLKELNILAGKMTANSPWVTILAYCGGWIEARSSHCEETPLVFGKNESCECHRLICPVCGYCSEKCERRAPRQREMQANQHP